MEKTWVLIANAERARCFERHATDHALTELIDFVHPHASLIGKAGGSDLTGAAGKGHGRTGHAGTQFEPRTEAHAKERASFARQIRTASGILFDWVTTARLPSGALTWKRWRGRW